jgi:ParB family chromosome partitioning protein
LSVTKERRLGRGLEALLGRIPAPVEPAATAAQSPIAAATPAADSTPAAPRPVAGAPVGRSEEHHGASPFGVSFPFSETPQSRRLVDTPHKASAAELAANHPPAAVSGLNEVAAGGSPHRVEVRLIDSNPYQPRRDFDEAETQSLAESLRAHGLLQPVVVRRLGSRYQLIAGERRLRAAVKAGWVDVPVQVIEADDRQVAELAIVENVQRKDLNPLEKAASFQRYLEQYACTQEELASRLKLDRSTIANLIRLLELPEAVQGVVRNGKITQGHARALLPLGEEREQVAFCERIQREGLSVRQTEALVQEAIARADVEPLAVIGRDGEKSPAARGASEHLAALEQQFRAALGMKVALRHNSRGRGRLVIQFRNHEEFEQLRQQICGPARSKARNQAG